MHVKLVGIPTIIGVGDVKAVIMGRTEIEQVLTNDQLKGALFTKHPCCACSLCAKCISACFIYMLLCESELLCSCHIQP